MRMLDLAVIEGVERHLGARPPQADHTLPSGHRPFDLLQRSVRVPHGTAGYSHSCRAAFALAVQFDIAVYDAPVRGGEMQHSQLRRA